MMSRVVALTIALAGLLLVLPPAHAQGSAASGLVWLKGQQHGDGSWYMDDRLAIRDTAQALLAFATLAPDDPVVAMAQDSLQAATGRGVDMEARRIEALLGRLPAVVLADRLDALATSRAADGGWGLVGRIESSSDALDTALALRALIVGGRINADVLYRGAKRLVQLQSLDGGYSQVAGDPSDVVTTAEVLLALSTISAVNDVSAARSAAVAFLTFSQNLDGGFPVFPGRSSDPGTTALVLRALMQAGADLSTAYAPARDYLGSLQMADGSWSHDAFTTAAACLVIAKAPPDLTIEGVLLAPEVVQRGTPVAVQVTVRNGGLSTAPAASVDLYLGDPNPGGISLGTHMLPELAPQASSSVAYTLPTLELAGSVALFAVVDVENAVKETSETNNRRAAILQVFRPGETPPPAGDHAPVFTSSPSLRATPALPYDYQVVAYDPDGDAISYSLVQAPPSMTIDAASGLLHWPAAGPDGGYLAITIIASDTNGTSSRQSFSLEIVDPNKKHPPVFDTGASAIGTVGVTYAYRPRAHDPDAADGGSITYGILNGPAGMVFDQASGGILWTPTLEQVGDNVVRLQARDGDGQTAEQVWIILVAKSSGPYVDLTPALVTATAMSTDPQTLAVGGAVRVLVANQGTAAAGEYRVVVYEERDDIEGFDRAQDQLLGSVRASGVASGGTVDVDVAVSGTLSFLGNRVFAFVDADQEIEERREDNNLYQSGKDKRFIATPGPIVPQLKLSHAVDENLSATCNPGAWTLSPFVLAPMADTDGDGKVGEGDNVNAVFFGNQTCARSVQAIDLKTNQHNIVKLMTLDGQPAIADFDRDGKPEIVAPTGVNNGNAMTMLNSDGTVRWTTPQLPIYINQMYGAPAIADLDGDGRGEIIMPQWVLNDDGTLRCRLNATSTFGMGGNMQNTPITVADLDLDGRPEIVMGNAAYRNDCSLMWVYPAGSTSYGGGFSTVAQLDDDPYPELALTSGDGLRVLEHDGTLKWGPIYGPQQRNSYVSVPAVGDLDGDGKAEIAFGDREGLVVFRRDGIQRWSYLTHDWGGTTRPTLADLDGDGQMEIIYSSWQALRIFRGPTGEVLWEAPTPQYRDQPWFRPTVADVDNDGHMEIVAWAPVSLGGVGPESDPNFYNNSGLPKTLLVYGSKTFAPARPLWNEYAYRTTNINCDLTIPEHELRNWEVTNAYWAGREVPDAVAEQMHCKTGPADLTASYLRVNRTGCPNSTQYIVRIGNGGRHSVPAGVEVVFTEAAPGQTPRTAGTVRTTKTLRPGKWEDVSIVVAPPGQGQQTIVAQVDPSGTIREQEQANNTISVNAYLCEYGNLPPQILSSPTVKANATVPYRYYVTSSDPDMDPTVLTLSTAPAGMVLASLEGPIVWTPSAAQVGDWPVALQISDGRGGISVQEFVIRVEAAPLVEPESKPAANLAIAVQTDSASYGPDAPVSISVTVQNTQPAGRTGKLRIDVADAGGGVIATPVPDKTLLFVGPQTVTQATSYDSDHLLPGAYRVIATYTEGAAESRAQAEIGVTAVASFSSNLTADKLVYGANEEVRLSATLSNGGPTGMLSDISGVIEILAPDGNVLSTETLPTTSLAPGQIATRQVSFNTALDPPGDYVARLTVRQVGTVLAVSQKPFTIASSAELGVALQGEVRIEPGSVAEGDSAVVTGTATNVGNADLTDLEVHLRVMIPGVPVYVRDDVQTLALARGQTASVNASFDTVGLSGPQLAIVDISANGRTLLHAQQVFTVLDVTPPVVSIAVPACTAQDVQPLVSVVEAHPGAIELVLDGLPFTDTVVTAEGTHALSAVATDTSNNVGTASAGFIIDRTPPAVSISGVSDGALLGAPVTPVVESSDANLVDAVSTMDGSPFVSGTQVSGEGQHVLAVHAADCAGNTTDSSASFVIDLSPPSIAVAGVQDGAFYGTSVNPEVTFQDANLTSTSLSLDGLPFASGLPVSDEGPHVIEASAADVVGHTTAAAVHFTLDFTPPLIDVHGVTDGAFYAAAVAPTIEISETNLADSSVLLDGLSFVSGTAIADEGAHELLVTATDRAGHQATASVRFTLDATPPQVSVSAPSCSGTDVTPVIAVTEANKASESRLLDGQPYAGGAVSEEGSHTLVVTVSDRAGHRVSETAVFIVDKSAPKIRFTGVADGQYYAAPPNATVQVDEANLTSTTALLDGALFASGTEVVGEGAHTLVVSAQDCAGHIVDASVTFTIDQTPPVVAIEAPECSQIGVTPTITITEANPATESRLLDGATYSGALIDTVGDHRLTVTATDRAGQTATATASITIDDTNPVVTISGVTSGAIYVSSVTPTISVDDDHLATQVVLLNGVPYVSGTPIEDVGIYTLAARAVDCARNEGHASVRFEIRHVNGSISQALVTRPRVLLAGESSGLPVSFKKTLMVGGIPVEDASGRQAWLTKLRSGRFDVDVLYRPDPSEATTAFEELGAAVWLGDGLVVIKEKPDAMPWLREVLGLDWGGTLTKIAGVDLLPPLGTGPLQIGSNAVRLDRLTAQSAATAQQGKETRTVAALSSVGLGRALSLAWDTETSPVDGFMLSMVNAIAPTRAPVLLPGAPVEMTTTITNTGGLETLFQVAHRLPAGVNAVGAVDGSVTLAPGVSGSVPLTVVVPDAAGAFTIGAVLTAGGVVLDSSGLDLVVPRSTAMISADIVTALAALPCAGPAGTCAAAAGGAITSIQAAQTRASPVESVADVLSAVAQVRSITGPDLTVVRIDLARLVRIYELRSQS